MVSRREILTVKRVVLFAGLLAGCAGLAPADEVNLRGAQRLADAAVHAYDVTPVRVEIEPGGARRFERPRIVPRRPLLTNHSGSAALPHGLAHHTLRPPAADGQRPPQQEL